VSGSPPTPELFARLTGVGLRRIHVYGATELYGPYMICERQEGWRELPPRREKAQPERNDVTETGAQPHPPLGARAPGAGGHGAVPGIPGNRHPSVAPYQLFPAADRPVVVAVGNDRQFTAFCNGLGVPELAADPRFATNPDRVAHVDALDEIVSARMATRPADHWFTVLSALGVPCGPVNDIASAFELAADLGLSGRIAVGEGPDVVGLVANPIELSDTPTAYGRRPPRLGQHTDEVRAWLRDRPAPGAAAPAVPRANQKMEISWVYALVGMALPPPAPCPPSRPALECLCRGCAMITTN
jgi:CoA-transferase family III